MGLTAIPEAKRGGIYRRMETDDEYRARLYAAHKPPPGDVHGAALDAFGDGHGIQRRLVWSEC